ncbi:MAG: TetR/AcrR family transcriptional regulator C-terminal domain-containing protein [Clostridia bacterium]|nr:TetR/AcrR family transcriptional regulator C-terminal domain-containing protein [Clostridia bacterium]
MYQSRNSFTSSLMVEALLLLLEKEEYDSISVKNICEKAGVNRSTFYSYYNTKDDLLVETMKLISKRLLSNFDYDTIILNVDDENNYQLIGEIYLVPCLNTIKELRKVYKMLQHKSHIFKKLNINKELYNILHNKLLSKYNIKNDEKEFAFEYFNYGVLAIIDKWVESNCEEDVSKIANLIIKMIGF